MLNQTSPKKNRGYRKSLENYHGWRESKENESKLDTKNYTLMDEMGLKRAKTNQNKRKLFKKLAKHTIRLDEMRMTQATNQVVMATWNVIGTYKEGALKILAQIFNEYGVDVAALQETNKMGILVWKFMFICNVEVKEILQCLTR